MLSGVTITAITGSHRDSDKLYVFDAEKKTVQVLSLKQNVMKMEVTVLSTIATEENSLIYGLSVTTNENFIYATDFNYGLRVVDLRSLTSHAFSQGKGWHGVCTMSNDDELIVTDSLEKRILKISKEGEVNVLAGGSRDQVGSIVDGVSPRFAQPAGICCEGKTLYMVDAASGHIIVVTSLIGTYKCFGLLRDIYKSYNMHPEIMGTGSEKLTDTIDLLSQVNDSLDCIVQETMAIQGLDLKSPVGPHGTITAQTIKSHSMAKKQFIEINDTLKDISIEYADKVKPKSLLTLPNEHLHGVIRMQNETPNVLECGRIFRTAVKEVVKKQTDCGFHIVTKKKQPKDGYEQP